MVVFKREVRHFLLPGDERVTDHDQRDNSEEPDVPSGSVGKRVVRAGLQAVGGAIPLVGGLLSAAISAWSEHEQDHVNKVFKQWLQMLEDELREKAKTIVEVMARVDSNDEKTRKRIELDEYQTILKKAFRNWSNIDLRSKTAKNQKSLGQCRCRRVLASDDVVKLFLDWIDLYSDFHFEVIGEIYRNRHITRVKSGGISVGRKCAKILQMPISINCLFVT